MNLKNNENNSLISNIDGPYKIAVGKYSRDFSVVDNELIQIMNASNE